jgi:sterol desaturase/sphingolipid hydroxylase (fatty acid hydroxylase superfamily)
MLIKISVVVMLGVPAVAVIIFEIILSSSALFNHANVSLPRKLDRWLEWVIVTPDMHRIHHSVEDDETNSNFGFFLSWWDRLFGSYRAEARRDQSLIEIGIYGFNDEKQVNRLPGMLMLPFVGKISRYAINTRRWEQDKPE